jgi:hypothetical protein
MALPIRPNNPNIPIPNTSFSSPLNAYVNGPYFPVVMGTGIDITTPNKIADLNNAGVLEFSGATGDITLTAGAGISVVETDSNFTVSNDGVLQLIAGSNVTISGSNGVFTVSATNGGGGTVTSVATSAALTGGPITTSGTLDLATTGVTSGSYSYPTALSVDACGRITSLSSFSSAPVTHNDFQAKGDILAGTGIGAFTDLSVGTDGQILYACSGATTGLCWANPPATAPATPTVEGIVFGCTDSTNYNYGLGDGIFGALTTGTLNIAVGAGALATTDTGTSNTAVGIGALYSNTSGIQNVALGQQALSANTTTGLNTAIGSQALQNTTGGANTALGNYAGNVLTTGCSNILIGNQSGGIGPGALDTGNNNVVIGNCISVTDGTGDCQLAIGVSNAGTSLCWLTGDSTGAIKPGAGIIDCAGSCGTAGQVLSSDGSNAIEWITPSGGGSSPATPTTEGTLYGCSADSNVSVGLNSLLSLTTGTSNVAIGCEALSCVTDGISNVAVGRALVRTTGNQNTGVGAGALFLNTSGGFNTTVGNNAMVFNTTGCFNTSIGQASLYCGTTGNQNVGLGYQSGMCITTGSQNVAIGPSAQVATPTASCQLAIGFSTTDNWITGTSTKAIKPGAGIIDCAGSCGTAGQVLSSNGSNAIQWITPSGGGASAATPTAAGIVLGRTTLNAAGIGCNALLSLTTGTCNTAMGSNALRAITNSTGNSAFGCNALCSLTSGSWNTSVGVGAGQATTTGNNNVAVGTNAMFGIMTTVTGTHNTAIGSSAMFGVTTGSGNIAIGGARDGGSYVPVFGFTTECNRVAVGSTAVTNAYIQVAWTAVSDARDKTNITALPVGLDFVNQMNPVSFQYREDRDSDVPNGPVRYGFLAQEVLSLEGDDPVLVDAEDENKLRMTYDHMNAVLVKAIQELSAKVDSLQTELETLKANG